MTLTVKCSISKDFKDGTVFKKDQFYEALSVWKKSPDTKAETLVAWKVWPDNNKLEKRFTPSPFYLHFKLGRY